MLQPRLSPSEWGARTRQQPDDALHCLLHVPTLGGPPRLWLCQWRGMFSRTSSKPKCLLRRSCHLAFFLAVCSTCLPYQSGVHAITAMERVELKEEVSEMFDHAFGSYLSHAYPADELMPLSCKGRYRGSEGNRGDIDDALGNFSLTLVDSLDTLVVLNKLSEFEKAVKLVIKDVSFDRDVTVSVFETNIRMIGGLLSGHVFATLLRDQTHGEYFQWYKDELLKMASDCGYRLLPAFNTTSGIPYPRVNLQRGITKNLRSERDTCTACAGTIILEFAALSRLSGDPVFEEKAHKAMQFLWQQRHRSSDLMGTVINIHNGDWIRRDSGVGAGIDSYYEYCFKGYVLLGDEIYLERFNKHYTAIMKYISQGPLLVDVHMHKPQTNSRNFMDALLAFWPALQVLKGDIKPAIETHEMLYQVVKRHNFLPEAFTTDFRIHWPHSPLRPEFVESTYFLYKATGDPYYLDVGRDVVRSLQKHARVPCGFAGVKDVRTGAHTDQMDSYVLAELFKYLYLLFAEEGKDVAFNLDDFIFTTEAHLLPLSLARLGNFTHPQFHGTARVPPAAQLQPKQPQPPSWGTTRRYSQSHQPMSAVPLSHAMLYERSCPNNQLIHQEEQNYYSQYIREPLANFVQEVCPKPKQSKEKRRLKAKEFISGNSEQLGLLTRMGIRLMTLKDGRVQLLHTSSAASSVEDAQEGLEFMQEMIEMQNEVSEKETRKLIVQLTSSPHFGRVMYAAGPAQFGMQLKGDGVHGPLTIADPLHGCSAPTKDVSGTIVLVERGECMFMSKARVLQTAGAIGGIVLDNTPGSSASSSPMFAMSGDGGDNVHIPLVFLYRKEGLKLMDTAVAAADTSTPLEVLLSDKAKSIEVFFQPVTVTHRQEQDGVTHITVEKVYMEDSHDTAKRILLKTADMGSLNMYMKLAESNKLLAHLFSMRVEEIGTKHMKASIVTQRVDSKFSGGGQLETSVVIQRAEQETTWIKVTVPAVAVKVADDQNEEDIEPFHFFPLLQQRLLAHTNIQSLQRHQQFMAAVRQLTDVALGKDDILDIDTLTALDELLNLMAPLSPNQEAVTMGDVAEDADVDTSKTILQQKQQVTVVTYDENGDLRRQSIQQPDNTRSGVGTVQRVPLDSVFQQHEIHNLKPKQQPATTTDDTSEPQQQEASMKNQKDEL